MAEQEMGPERLTAKGLPNARRGYDHKAVERLLEEARQAWADLEREHRRLLAEIERVGGLEYLARDLGAVGTDVGRLLADAQEAARGLRERARIDSAERLAGAAAEAQRLVAEAEEEAFQVRAEAGEQAFQVRADAWAAGMELLRQAVETGREMEEEAEADILVIRAEAEQEAHRLVAGARRESQDVLREARFAAERALSEARAQAEQPAPVATTPPAPPPPTEAGRSAAAGRRRHRAPEVAPADMPDVIRVIQPSEGPRQVARPSVDPGSYGDALAAEVEALWESGEMETVPQAPSPPPPLKLRKRPKATAERQAPEPAPEPAGEPPVGESAAGEAVAAVVVEPTVAEAVEAAVEAGPGEVGVEEEPGEVGVEEEPGEAAAPVEPAQVEAGVAAPPPVAAPVAPVPEVETTESGPGVVEDLFARLRVTHRGGGRRRRGALTGSETLPGLGPPPATRAADRGPAPDAVELREGLVLPVQNRALRRVKENLLELQNAALDSLRTSGAWEGSGAALAALAPALDPVAEEGAEAGAQAAAAFIGGEPPAPVIGARSATLVQAMAEELAAQVGAALAETSGAGPLELSAAVSRVFRAWRGEEAEHWVRTVAYAAYHDSLLAGLAVAGVKRVSPVAHGLLCAECPAFHGVTWDPADEPPSGTARPPVHSHCVCTVAPA
jgi:cell division septum initiation protein DivIVA